MCYKSERIDQIFVPWVVFVAFPIPIPISILFIFIYLFFEHDASLRRLRKQRLLICDAADAAQTCWLLEGKLDKSIN